MGRAVAIVTDSTAYLDSALSVGGDIAVVPLQVVVEGRPYMRGRHSARARPRRPLRQRVRVSTTSRPSPRAFLDVYEAAAASGAGGIVSVHISGHLSGTADAARLAAHDSPSPSSRRLGLAGDGARLRVMAAVEARSGVMTVDQVAEVARRNALSVVGILRRHLVACRGGRIGAAAALPTPSP